MSRKYEREREHTRLALLNAALGLILEHGYDAVTVADIVRCADYGRSTFYSHFKNKEDIIWAILEHHLITLDADISTATEGLSSPKKEWIAWQMIFRDIDRQRPFFLQMDGETSRRLRQRLKNLQIQVFEAKYRAGTHSLLLDMSPEITARFVVGAASEVLDYWLSHPEAGSADEMAAKLFTMLYRQEPPK